MRYARLSFRGKKKAGFGFFPCFQKEIAGAVERSPKRIAAEAFRLARPAGKKADSLFRIGAKDGQKVPGGRGQCAFPFGINGKNGDWA